MKRTIIMLLVFALIGGITEANAQWLKSLGKKVENAAKRKIEQKAEEKTEEAVDDILEGNFGKDKKNNEENKDRNVAPESSAETPQSSEKQQEKSLEMTYAKSDFVPGDEIFFDDLTYNEQMGEFPSQWDLLEGTAEVANINGEKAIMMLTPGEIAPLMEDMTNYLPEKFTVEFDYWKNANGYTFTYYFWLMDGRDHVLRLVFGGGNDELGHLMQWDYYPPNSEDSRSGEETSVISSVEQDNAWNHFSLSFNKRALKIYVNGTRIANIPNMKAPKTLKLASAHNNEEGYIQAFRNVRLAKGAVPLYDRMMSEGKFITYGITFDVNKSTIKPESMGEINRIVQLMNENPTLKFSVEGHTDSTGNAAGNQTLSEQRAKAIVAKLVEMGITADRLTAVGKGQNNPIADNSTDEGRAKNRRVEFVKL